MKDRIDGGAEPGCRRGRDGGDMRRRLTAPWLAALPGAGVLFVRPDDADSLAADATKLWLSLGVAF